MKGLWSRLAPWVVSALLAFTALWLTARVIALRSENQSLLTERMLAEVAYKLGQTQLAERTLLAENMINHLGTKLRRSEDLARLRICILAAPAGSSQETQGVVIWDPELQTGLLSVEKLPLPATVYDCQLWITYSGIPEPVSGGVIQVAADGRAELAFKPDPSAAQAIAFAVSVEKKGGSPKAEGRILLLGNIGR